ncbi:hypothetical protein TNCV_4296961 [Trichonephila clavipes]|nr:hypothetical protein TNCV_4296961 [Trichonephila clavipes]
MRINFKIRRQKYTIAEATITKSVGVINKVNRIKKALKEERSKVGSNGGNEIKNNRHHRHIGVPEMSLPSEPEPSWWGSGWLKEKGVHLPVRRLGTSSSVVDGKEQKVHLAQGGKEHPPSPWALLLGGDLKRKTHKKH